MKLVAPTVMSPESIDEFRQEFFDAGEKMIPGSALLDRMSIHDWLEHVIRNSEIETVEEGWVKSSTFFALDYKQEIVGIVDFRHSIAENEFLRNFGGHVGYAVRPSQRKKGYGTEILKKMKRYGELFGLSELMVGCLAKNKPSARVIEKCGGVLKTNKTYTDGQAFCVYTIALNPENFGNEA